MCLALNRSAFDEAGGFGEEYRHGYFEDLALSCRLRTLGYRLAIREDCFVYHEGHASYRNRPRDEKFEIIRATSSCSPINGRTCRSIPAWWKRWNTPDKGIPYDRFPD